MRNYQEEEDSSIQKVVKKQVAKQVKKESKKIAEKPVKVAQKQLLKAVAHGVMSAISSVITFIASIGLPFIYNKNLSLYSFSESRLTRAEIFIRFQSLESESQKR